MAESGYLKRKTGFATSSIHAGHDPDSCNSSSVVLPIVHSTIFKQDFTVDGNGRYKHGRSDTPTRQSLEECLATLENGKYGLCFASGSGAIATITALLSAGDQIVSGEDIYGGTTTLFVDVFARMGIETTFVNVNNPDEIKSALTPRTKMVWIESLTNPLMQIPDFAAVSAILKDRPDIILVVDSTFLTPYFQNPLDFGADIVMHSITKYINGHTDVFMGAAITNNEDLYKRMKFLQTAMGSIPSPVDCYQVFRGIKTLPVRMDHHMKSSIEVAKWLESHKMIRKVLHPGLPSHPQHELAKKQAYGCSGMFSFYIKGDLKHSKEFIKALKIFTLAVSVGGVESLVQIPSLMTHAGVPKEQRIRMGITDDFIRVSLGLEDVKDLINDLDQALEKAFKV